MGRIGKGGRCQRNVGVVIRPSLRVPGGAFCCVLGITLASRFGWHNDPPRAFPTKLGPRHLAPLPPAGLSLSPQHPAPCAGGPHRAALTARPQPARRLDQDAVRNAPAHRCGRRAGASPWFTDPERPACQVSTRAVELDHHPCESPLSCTGQPQGYPQVIHRDEHARGARWRPLQSYKLRHANVTFL